MIEANGKNYHEIHCSTAEDFWTAIGPTGKFSELGTFVVYRGHAQAEWSLVPSALRDNEFLDVFSSRGSARNRVAEELRLLEQFLLECDRVGIRLPNDISVIDLFSDTDYFREFPKKWPSSKFYNCLALAQHHGIPTRLLDWSNSPYIAAYMAVSGALKLVKEKQNQKDHLAVWALSTFTSQKEKYADVFEIIRVNRSLSKNLVAQSGLFTTHFLDVGENADLEIRGLEDVIKYEGSGRMMLYKITLPLSQCDKLYKLCKVAGVTAASIYPNADGAKSAVLDDLNFYDFVKKKSINVVR